MFIFLVPIPFFARFYFFSFLDRCFYVCVCFFFASFQTIKNLLLFSENSRCFSLSLRAVCVRMNVSECSMNFHQFTVSFEASPFDLVKLETVVNRMVSIV